MKAKVLCLAMVLAMALVLIPAVATAQYTTGTAVDEDLSITVSGTPISFGQVVTGEREFESNRVRIVNSGNVPLDIQVQGDEVHFAGTVPNWHTVTSITGLNQYILTWDGVVLDEDSYTTVETDLGVGDTCRGRFEMISAREGSTTGNFQITPAFQAVAH